MLMPASASLKKWTVINNAIHGPNANFPTIRCSLSSWFGLNPKTLFLDLKTLENLAFEALVKGFRISQVEICKHIGNQSNGARVFLKSSMAYSRSVSSAVDPLSPTTYTFATPD